MNDLKVSIDHYKYKIKPTGREIGQISNRICKCDRVVVLKEIKDFELFANLVGEKGCTFCPATFRNESRSQDNFEQMQILALDFDGGISLQQVIERAKKYYLPIFIAYETFTSVGQNKFRILFMNDISITDKRLAKISMNALLTIFPEADRSCNDISKIYFGGKKLHYFDQSLPTINTEALLMNMTYYLKSKYGITHYKKYIEEFAKKHKINNKKFPPY